MIAAEPTAVPSTPAAAAGASPNTEAGSAQPAGPFGALLKILLGMNAAPADGSADPFASTSEPESEPEEAPSKGRVAPSAVPALAVPYAYAPLVRDEIALAPTSTAVPEHAREQDTPAEPAERRPRVARRDVPAPASVSDASAAPIEGGDTQVTRVVATEIGKDAEGADRLEHAAREASTKSASPPAKPVEASSILKVEDASRAEPQTTSERMLAPARGRITAPPEVVKTSDALRQHDSGDDARGAEPAATLVTEAAPQVRDITTSTAAAPAERATVRRPVAEQIVGPIVGLRHEGRQTLSVRLDPPELGAVHIEAVLDGRHISLAIRTEQAAARAAVEGSLPVIRQALVDRGFVADQLSVQLGMDTTQGGGYGGPEQREEPAPIAPREPLRARPAPSRRVTVEGLDLLV